MGKLMLQIHVTLDGFMCGPNNEMDFVSDTMPWSDDLNTYVQGIMADCKGIVLGRRLAEGFVKSWEENPDKPGADKMINLPKTVFSQTLDRARWNNSTLINVNSSSEIAQNIRKMKDETGTLISYGGARLANTLLEEGLVDELYLIISPSSIGQGKRLFTSQSSWKAVEAKTFECGAVVLRYSNKK